MKISCPNCSAAYELDDARVPPAGLSIKCPKCKNPFTVHKPKTADNGGRAKRVAAATSRVKTRVAIDFTRAVRGR